jgi:plastocyanin
MTRLLAAIAALLLAGCAAAATTHVVTIDGVTYAPAALTVKRGDTVVWRNKDPFPHTVTAAREFDSGSIAAGREWKLVARKPGAYAYLCTLHPNMQGTLTIE